MRPDEILEELKFEPYIVAKGVKGRELIPGLGCAIEIIKGVSGVGLYDKKFFK